MPVVFRCECGKRWKALSLKNGQMSTAGDDAGDHSFACPTCGKLLTAPAAKKNVEAAENPPAAGKHPLPKVGALGLAAAVLVVLGAAWLWGPWQRGDDLPAGASSPVALVTEEPAPASQTTPATKPIEKPAAPEKADPPEPAVSKEPAPTPAVVPIPKAAPSDPPAEKPATPADPPTQEEPKPAEPEPKQEPKPKPAVPSPEFKPIVAPPERVEMTKAVRQKVQQGLRASGAVARGKAVRELKAYPSPEALDLLWRPALQDPDADIRSEAQKILADYRRDKELCVGLLERIQQELKKNPKFAEQPGVPGLVRTVATYFYPETVLPLVEWFEHSNPELAYAAADGILTAVRDQGSVRRVEGLPLIAQLAETKYFEGHFGFRRTLVESTLQMRDKEALPLLIEWLPKLSARLRDITVAHLESATGEKHGEDVALWRKWWKENAESFKFKTEVIGVIEAIPGNVNYYGVQARTNRVIFIFDTSSSMLDGTSVQNKLVGAKQALIATIEKLPADVSFNIVTFNTTVSAWKPTPLAANEANKKAAVEHVTGLQARGRTNSSEALMTAFRMDRNVETIFFVSDGAPSTGPIIEPGLILEAIHKVNRVQRATIHAVGVFGGVPEPGIFEVFMKRLAEENEGRYVRHE